MTTHDLIASGSVTYKTIGWTIKRYNTGVYDPVNQCAFIPLTSAGDSRVDPEDSRYCYSYFYCDKDTVYEAIGQVSSEWRESLYRNGGTVFLDAIMTVCHNGAPQGVLYDSRPTYEGEVYFTFDGIAGARPWRDTMGLISHFDKQVAFPANPSLLKETSYVVNHLETTAGGQTHPLRRYGRDRSGILTYRPTLTFDLSDFSAHHFSFHHSKASVTYLDGAVETLTSYQMVPVSLDNQSRPVKSVTVIYYYIRTNKLDTLTHSYLLDEGKLQTQANGLITASSKNSEAYQVSQGIPSGSFLDISTSLSPYACSVNYHHYFGELTCVITVNTVYDLVWNDSAGSHRETVTLSELYYVDRPYSFYLVTDYSVYILQSVLIFQEALEHTFTTISNPAPAACLTRLNGDMRSHYWSPVPAPLSIQGGTIQGSGKRPSLPYNRQQAAAEAAVGNIRVNNDFFQIGDFILSEDTSYDKTTKTPVCPSNIANTILSEKEAYIPPSRRNKDSYETTAIAYYTECRDENDRQSRHFRANSVKVHTPVVCDTKISDDKKFNQQKQPDATRGTLVLGREFQLLTSCTGSHKDIPGYGSRDYSEYVEAIQVLFPFPVYSGDACLTENTWHTISPDQTLYLPTGVTEGNYVIQARVLAKNTPLGLGLDLTEFSEDGANIDLTHTIAARSIPVCVTGRLYGLTLSSKDTYRVGGRDLNGLALTNPTGFYLPTSGNYNVSIPFTLETIGSPPTDKDYLSITPHFYHVDENGKNRQPVDLYLLSSNDSLQLYNPSLSLSSEVCTFIGDSRRNVSNPETARKSVQRWDGTFLLSEPFVIVPKGTSLISELEEKGSLSLKDSCFLQDGFLLINFSITYERTALPSLDYLNLENAKKGYCNMWKTEGFSYTQKDAANHIWTFLDGDCLLFTINPKRKIVQTH